MQTMCKNHWFVRTQSVVNCHEGIIYVLAEMSLLCELFILRVQSRLLLCQSSPTLWVKALTNFFSQRHLLESPSNSDFRVQRRCVTNDIFLFGDFFCVMTHSFTIGGKPSTWFPPGGLVEQNFGARSFGKKQIFNLTLSLCLFLSLCVFLQKWLSHLNDEMCTSDGEQYAFEMT